MRRHFQDVIENHPLNGNYDLRADDVAALLEGSAGARKAAFWRELISGQMDADRMDYLLRDSLHAGVQYGRFDVGRLVLTVRAVPGNEGAAPRLGVSEGGWHAAEALILARYFMFTQVYFHKTRVAFDHHLHEALKELLPNGCFPAPEGDGLDEYLRWDDWRVLGLLADGKAGEHGERLARRDHYREVYHTAEVPTAAELEHLERVRDALGSLLATEQSAEKSWYATGRADIPVVGGAQEGNVQPLSNYSSVVANLRRNRRIRFYARREDSEAARLKVQTVEGDRHA